MVLNDDPSLTSNPRFKDEVSRRGLMLLVLRFQRLEAALKEDSYDPRKAYDPFTQNRQIANAMAALNRALRRYVLSPRLIPDYKFGCEPLGWELSYEEPKKMLKSLEFSRVRQIEKIALEGKISYLKQCVQCQRWLYAKFSHQRFCSADCKDSFHQTNEADKARRRDWARNNYKLHKTKNVK